MYGHEYNVACIIEAAGNAEYIGAIIPVLLAGTFSAHTTIPLYTSADIVKASKIAKKTGSAYKAPVKAK